MKILIPFFLILVFGTSLFSEVDFKDISLEQAFVIAKQNDKKIMIDFYTDWCAPCKLLDSVIFQDSTISSFINSNYISIKIDAEKGSGPDIMAKFKIPKSYPTVLLLNYDAVEIDRINGLGPKEQFLNNIRDYSENRNTLTDYLSQIKSGNNDIQLKLKIANKYFSRHDFKKAITYYEQVIIEDPNIMDEFIWYQLANAYFRIGNLNEAEKSVSKSIEINGDVKFIKDFLKRIENEINNQNTD